MAENQEFANLQVLCGNRRIVAKKVYESLLKGYKTPGTDALSSQFDLLLNIFGCADSVSDDARRSIHKVFNMASSSPYFLRKYDDGWTAILHERFSVANIASYALQYSQGAREHLVIALGYDNEQFLCVAFQDGKTVFKHSVYREDKNDETMCAAEIERFATRIGSAQEDVLRMVKAEYHEQLAAIARVFKHDVVASPNDINSVDRSLYVAVSGRGHELIEPI